MQPFEGEFFQLVLHVLHPDATGERRVDVQGFLCVAAAAFGLSVFQRAHIVQPVGELDEQHADVAGDGDQQLAEILRLLRPAR